LALSKEKKIAVIQDVSDILANSKLVVVARYQGTSVKAMQELRRQARDSQTQVRIVKNRLFKKAVEQNEKLKNTDTSFLTGQLMYASSNEDELAPAKVVADFAKSEPQIEFVAAFSKDGLVMPAEDVQALADLPTKDQLKAQLVGLLSSPLTSFNSVLTGNIRGMLNVLSARAE